MSKGTLLLSKPMLFPVEQVWLLPWLIHNKPFSPFLPRPPVISFESEWQITPDICVYAYTNGLWW
jgi:hypothetical protein